MQHKTKTILSGIRATGKLHVGNYLGALKQFINLQNQGYKCFFFVADLHALTTPFEPKELRTQTYEVVAEYIAAGLDPEQSTIFLQNHIAEHTELAWALNCVTPIGELERMTQYKDKAKTHTANINAGLFTYPTLMAADILLYKPDMVPVGDDQTQHLELTRSLAKRFNQRFGKTFPEPKNYLLKPLRIRSLQDPEKKMSKTADIPVYISDSPEDIATKLKKAVTATTGGGASAGVDNLFFLLEIFGTEDEHKYFVDAEKEGTIKYSELKATLASRIAEHFADFRAKKQELMKDKEYVAEILAEGARKARLTASHTLAEVKEKLGLL
ncbi:MAG TPA: tryptophan--tRNA ligase [Patescibacteria group bacterium]|nr:tryptophan--tRNA ligase [Patescibacteria group bacterium]